MWETRPGGPGVGCLSAADVDAELSRLAEAMARTLARRGVDPDAARDMAQEAVARALAKARGPQPFTSLDHLRRWCFLTAWRLATDQWRRSQRHPVTGDLPDVPVGDGLDGVVQHRRAVRQVLAAAATLTTRQQWALGRILRADFGAMQEFLAATDRLAPAERVRLEPLLDYLADPATAPEVAPGTDRWARHDVRQRLRRLVEDLPVVAPLWRLARAIHQRLAASEQWLAAAAMAGATAAVSLFAAGVGHQPAQAVQGAGSPAPLPAAPSAPVATPVGPGLPATVRAAGSGTPLAAGPVVSTPPASPPPGVHVVTFPDPGGGSGVVRLVPNGPDRPLACADVMGAGGCIDKPVRLAPPGLPAG